jgi:hypothetical protein
MKVLTQLVNDIHELILASKEVLVTFEAWQNSFGDEALEVDDLKIKRLRKALAKLESY